ncbi:hypothetical protein D3C78_1804580 [compost metagenome]
MAVVDPLEVVDIEHQQRQRLLMSARHIDLPLQGLLHGDAVTGAGQRIAQGTLSRLAIKQRVAHRVQQG